LCQWEAWSGYLAFNEQYMLSMLCQDDSKPNVYSGSCGTDLSNEPRKSVQDRSCNAPPRRTCREPLVADNLPDISATAVVLAEDGVSSEIPGDISSYRNWQPGSKNCIRQNACTLNELENEAAVTLQHFWRKKVQISISMRVSAVGDDQSGERCASPELCIAPALVRAVRQMRAAGEEAMTELSLAQWQHMQEALEDALHGLREAGRSSRIKQEVEQDMQEVEEGVQFVKYMIHKYTNELGMKQHPLASKSRLSVAAPEIQWDPMHHPANGPAIAESWTPDHACELYHGMAILQAAAVDALRKPNAANGGLSNPLDLDHVFEALMIKAELQSKLNPHRPWDSETRAEQRKCSTECDTSHCSSNHKVNESAERNDYLIRDLD